jgi:predicted ArsR family transcriptional regulator
MAEEHHRPGREAVLAALRATGGQVSAADLAGSLSLHPNTVRGHLELLVAAGYASRAPEHRDERGRPRILYRLAGDSPERCEGYRTLATVLAIELAGLAGADRQAADAAGRVWASWLSTTGRLSPAADADEALALVRSIFEGLGFEVATEPLGDRLYLARCPYTEQVDRFPGVCDLHLGLLRGAFHETGDHVRVTDVTVNARPGLCIAHLRAGPGPTRPETPEETA